MKKETIVITLEYGSSWQADLQKGALKVMLEVFTNFFLGGHKKNKINVKFYD